MTYFIGTTDNTIIGTVQHKIIGDKKFNLSTIYCEMHVKERTISMKLVVDFVPIHGNAYTRAAALASRVKGPHTNKYNVIT